VNLLKKLIRCLPFCFSIMTYHRVTYLIPYFKQNNASDATSDAKMQARTGYLDCFSDCAIQMGAPWNPAAGLPCAAICAFSRKLEDTPAKMDIAIQNFKTCKFLLRYIYYSCSSYQAVKFFATVFIYNSCFL
jgi:hypothetical protein